MTPLSHDLSGAKEEAKRQKQYRACGRPAGMMQEGKGTTSPQRYPVARAEVTFPFI